MSTRTRIVTVEITFVEKNPKSQDETKQMIAEQIKKQLNADNVVVKAVKDFVMDDQPKKVTAKKTTKKAEPKKESVKKAAPAKKTTTKKAESKKETVKKTPAKKTTTKKEK